jgi:predicted alpha/beta hydrolase
MIVLEVIGLIVGGLLAALVVYLVIVVFTPLVSEPLEPFSEIEGSAPPAAPPGGVRRDVRFGPPEQELAGWLYLPPQAKGRVACVVMNNGCGGTKEVALQPFALRFVEAGLAVLTYDYLHFGESAGQPRQHLSLDQQVRDCRRAIAYVRSLPGVDPDRLAIWSTSSAGGYGVVVAAGDEDIRCLVSQCPSLDHGADGKQVFAREGLGWFLRLIMHAQRDKGRSRFGLSPHHIPIVGPPGSTALLTAPGAFEGYSRLAGSGFVNKVCGRVMLTPHGVTPDQVIERVRCPALFQICDDDSLASADAAVAQAQRMGSLATIERYPIGHFAIYEGEHFERAVAGQVDFLLRHLSAGQPRS